jgi:hypothetical protein
MNLRRKFAIGCLGATLAGLGLVPGCGAGIGGGGGTAPPAPAPVANSVDVSVGPGPTNNAVNFAFVSVTVCNPGGMNACTTIPDVLVDTGSSGLRILASAPGISGLTLGGVTVAGSAIYECVPYADGSYLWGQVMSADVSMAGENATTVPVQILADTPMPTNVASECDPLGGPNLTAASALQANGILGIGVTTADCGTACSTSNPLPFYWLCTSSSACSGTAFLPMATQTSNPVAFFNRDDNGVILAMSSVAAGGAASATGILTFGVGTQSDNALSSSAKVYPLSEDFLFGAQYHTILATYNGTTYPALIDSSASSNLFLDAPTVAAASAGSAITYCPGSSYLFCLSAGTASPLSLPFTAKDSNGDSSTVNLSIGDAMTLLNSSILLGGANTAVPGLTGGYALGGNDYVDLGLPFFYNRTVYVGYSGQALPTGVTNAPLGYWAF